MTHALPQSGISFFSLLISFVNEPLDGFLNGLVNSTELMNFHLELPGLGKMCSGDRSIFSVALDGLLYSSRMVSKAFLGSSDMLGSLGSGFLGGVGSHMLSF